MARKRVHLWALSGLKQLRALVSITLCFAVGSVAGCWSSAVMEREGAQALRDWLSGYVSLSQSGGGGGRWLSVLWQMLRLPVALTLLQYTVLGMVMIPLLMGLRGFLLSFAVTGFVRAYAWRGILAALLLFGPVETVELSALFVLSLAGTLRADSMGRENRGGTMVRVSPLRLAACWAALLLCSAAQLFLAAPLSSALAALLG